MSDLYRIAREVTDSVLPPITLRIGGRYIHPEDGEIEIVGGCYRDPTYGRISNFWNWTVVSTGEHKNGYGDNWPEAEERCVLCGEARGPDGFEDGLRCKLCAEQDEAHDVRDG